MVSWENRKCQKIRSWQFERKHSRILLAISQSWSTRTTALIKYGTPLQTSVIYSSLVQFLRLKLFLICVNFSHWCLTFSIQIPLHWVDKDLGWLYLAWYSWHGLSAWPLWKITSWNYNDNGSMLYTVLHTNLDRSFYHTQSNHKHSGEWVNWVSTHMLGSHWMPLPHRSTMAKINLNKRN